MCGALVCSCMKYGVWDTNHLRAVLTLRLFKGLVSFKANENNVLICFLGSPKAAWWLPTSSSPWLYETNISAYDSVLVCHTHSLSLLFFCNVVYFCVSLCHDNCVNHPCYRHPETSGRPSFASLVSRLSQPENQLLKWTDRNKNVTHSQSTMLGAPLETASNLYSDLQNTYM